MAEVPTFRGYWSIKEALERMAPLAEWTKKFKPQQRHLTLLRKDYDLIRRWPKAAHIHQIEVVGDEVWYQGLELTYDSGPKRYGKAEKPVQSDLADDRAVSDP